jgi:hypothetical protein
LNCEEEDAPSYYYPSSITYYESDGTGVVYYPTYMTGSSNDVNYARFYTPYEGDTAKVVAQLNSAGQHGYITVYGKCLSGYSGNLYVYVSYDNQSWTYVGYQYITSTSPYWIDFGYVQTCFTYIAVCGYNSGSSAAYLYVDSVRVTP